MLAVVTVMGLWSPAGAAADVTVDFEGFAPETVITSQYADLGGPGHGVTFGPLPGGAGSGFAPIVKSAPGQAHSGTHVADISNCRCTAEFYAASTTGTFQSGRQRVSARVGLASPSDPAQVTLRAYNANGDEVGTSSTATVAAGAGYHTLLSVEVPAGTIRGFRIASRPGADDSKPVRIDDVSFDTPTAPPAPDFTVTPASTFLVMSQGQTLRNRIAVARTAGSSGDVAFSLSGPLPAGVTARFDPNPASGDATDLILTADPQSGTTGFDPITVNVTATPGSPGAGSEPRTFPIQLQVRQAFDLRVDGPADVDLSACAVKVPVLVSRDFGFAGPVQLSVAGAANGVGASFEPAQITFPNGAGAETSNLVVTAPASGLPVPPTTLTVTASAPGHASRSAPVTVHGTCPAQYDARVTSLEITQGTQSEVLPQRYPESPTAPIAYSEIPNRATLRRSGPTIVRVYANLLFGPPGGAPNVPVVLYGSRYDRFGQRKAHADSPIAPVSGVRRLDAGPEHPPASEAASETAVYTFVLPQDWTKEELSIGADIEPSLGGGPRALTPCETPVCVQNDNMQISHIPFVGTRTATVNPLNLTVAGDNPHPAPAEVFRWARMMAPLELRMNPYASTVDVSDLKTKLTACVAAAPAGDPGKPARKKCSDDANSGAAGRVKDYSCDNSTHDREWNIGVNTGVARGLKSKRFCVLAAKNVSYAVIERQRPMTSTSHELGHLLGRPHADTECGGNDGGQSGEAWPPDNRGFLQSTGLATEPGTGISGGQFAVLAQPKQWFDYMSYCANSGLTSDPLKDRDAWISVRNWNKILDAFRFGKALPRDRPVRAAQGPRVRSLQVAATVTDTGTTIVGVAPVQAPPQPASPSPYRLQAFDASGTQTADVAMVESPEHVDGQPPVLALDGAVPSAAVTRIAVVRDGVVVAERSASPVAPRVSGVRVPAVRRGTATVSWRGSDGDGGELIARVLYSADGGRNYEQVWVGPNRGVARVPARLLPRSSRARLQVVVNDGFREGGARSRLFRSEGAPPEVTIISPTSGLTQPNDAPLALSGQAVDDSTRALSGRRLRWQIGSRLIGTGERISPAGLPAGRHRITLAARDRYGRVGRDSVVVRLSGARPLFLALNAPRTVKRSARSLRVRVSSSMAGRLTVSGAGGRAQRFGVGRRARRLTIRLTRGTRPLRLRMTLSAGRASNVRAVVVTRR